jgi:RNA polymerase sigma factor (TIGR02999 family)
VADVTQILNEFRRGDLNTSSKLLPLVYDELRKLARQRMASERADHTLQATALVHEAYVRLVAGPEQDWESRGHFFAAAAEAMRRILIEAARRKGAEKHGGDHQRVELDESLLQLTDKVGGTDRLLELDGALSKLAIEDPIKAELVKLRFFAGLSTEETAAALGISRATAARYWKYSRAFLRQEMSANGALRPPL